MSAPRRKLVLFDIDGTILLTKGVGRKIVSDALSSVCHKPIETDGVVFSGRTDPQIMRDILALNHISVDNQENVLSLALIEYADLVEKRLKPEHVFALPGIEVMIPHLAEIEAVQLALLTGNLETTAYAKLRAIDLDSFFPFGAFGSDHEERNELPRIAQRRAASYAGHMYGGKDVIVIGDTQRDIECSRTIGAYSVAVCTGRISRSDLAKEKPDLLLDDLSEVEYVVSHLLNS